MHSDADSTSTQPTGSDLARAWLEHSPFARLLGMRVESIGDGRAELSLPYNEKLATLGDVVHGGALSTLMDAAAAAAAWSDADPAETQRGSTASIAVTFLAPARAADLRAAATVVRRGRSLCFCEVVVTAGDDKRVSQALVTYKLG